MGLNPDSTHFKIFFDFGSRLIMPDFYKQNPAFGGHFLLDFFYIHRFLAEKNNEGTSINYVISKQISYVFCVYNACFLI
jgi:hypothetical protein